MTCGRAFSGALLFAFGLCLNAQNDGLSQSIAAIQDAIQAGNLSGASQLIEAALQKHHSEGGLINLRGVVKARRNDLSGARDDFKEAVRLAPALIPAWQNLARACTIAADQGADEASCAIRAWQRVLQAKPADTEARSSLAQMFFAAKEYADSLNHLAKLPAADASSPRNLLLRTFDLLSLGRGPEAKDAAGKIAKLNELTETDLEGFEPFLDNPTSAEVAVTILEPLRDRGTASPSSLKRLALAQERLGHTDDATKTLEHLVVLEPANPAHLLELARLAEASKNYERALGYLAHARDLTPNDPQVHFLFGMTAAAMQLPVEARRSLERALELNPKNPDYNYAMGSVILSTRDAASASHYFERFVEARPSDPRGHYALGIAYFAGGDYEKATEEMQSVAGQPNTAAGAEYFLGRIARLDNDISSAYQHLRRSIDLIPTYSESHTELARVYMLDGKMPEAHLELEKALRFDSESFQANNQLLVYYRRTKDSRAGEQEDRIKKLDEDRSRRSELMLRTIEVKP
jgi:tetratricopeptide (TPR) repeat protein